MFEYEKCSEILTAVTEKFKTRLELLENLYKKLEDLNFENSVSNDKLSKKLDKKYIKIEKFITKKDEKVFEKKQKLLNSNYLDELEKDIVNTAKILQSEENFFENMKDIVNEVIENEDVDYLNFVKKYLTILINSAKQNLNIYEKQLNFIQQVFKEEK